MSWIDTVENNVFLKTLYPVAAPTLEGVRLHRLELQQNGPVLLLDVELIEYPEDPPEKWKMAKSNTVQVRLMGIGICEMRISGWALNNVGRLSIRKESSRVAVGFDSDGCQIVTVVEALRVDGVSAYFSTAF